MFIGFCFYLITVASSYSGMVPPPGECPKVIPLPVAEFKAEVCPDTPCELIAVSAYSPVTKFIYLQASLEDQPKAVKNSFLLHEIVHWLQDYHGRITSRSCSVQIPLEAEAYAVQQMYLRQGDASFSVTLPENPAPGCFPEASPVKDEVIVL